MTTWNVEKIGAVDTDATGTTRIAVILNAVDATLVPEVDDQLHHDAANNGGSVSIPCPLSERELECLRLLSQGMVYKKIAVEMNLSVSTIRTHLHNVYAKLEVPDRAQAVLVAVRNGWID